MALTQHVHFPTHEKGHTLDLIITRRTDRLIANLPQAGRFISDHCAVLCQLNSYVSKVSPKVITYRKFKLINMEKFKDDIAKSDLCTNPSIQLDDLVSSYNNTLSSILDNHAPLIKKTVMARPHRVPWFSDEIKVAIRQRRKAERKWRISGLESHLKEFKTKKNYVIFLMNESRCKFYNSFVEKHRNNQRDLFRNSKQLLKQNSCGRLPYSQSDYALANDFGRFFVKKIADIRSKLCVQHRSTATDQHDQDYLETSDVPLHQKFSAFDEVSEDYIRTLITTSPTKSCSLDPIPTYLVKNCLDVLLPVITTMVNISLQTGHFPVDWKNAVVYPNLKKENSEPNFENYRPLSNLAFTSKLTEKAANNQLHTFLDEEQLFPSGQSAYRPYHSTETLLLKFKNDILLNMNKQHVTLVVLLDLSAAFDTVDHMILLRRLQHKFGISDTALKWFSSYLAGRSQRIIINGVQSDMFKLEHGVPQGPCLGPLLFVLYTSKLFDIVRSHLPNASSYADDSQLYLSFKPDHTANETTALLAMQSCVVEIKKWLCNDKLLMNDGKTEFIIIGTKQQLAKVNIDNITIAETNVNPISVAKNLGVWLDSSLSMSTHINKLCSAAFYHLRNIKRIRKYLSRESATILVHAFISSRLDYCNSLLYGLPAYQLNKLQRVQNAAARIIRRLPKFCHITPVLRELHWLPVKFRIDYKILLLTYKGLHEMCPDYLKDLLVISNNKRYNLRSSDSLLLKNPSFKSSSTLGDRSFQVAAPILWNALPGDIRDITNLDSFKRSLKTYLFKIAFNL